MFEVTMKCDRCGKEAALEPRLHLDGETLSHVCQTCEEELNTPSDEMWEYQAMVLDTAQNTHLSKRMDALNTMGQSGWELVYMAEELICEDNKDTLCVVYTFKRRVQ